MEANSSSALVSYRRQTWLHEAVKRKDLELIRHALSHSPTEFCVLDINGRSPLVTAMLDGAWELVSVMLDCQTIDLLAVSRTDVMIEDNTRSIINGWTVYHRLSMQYQSNTVRGIKYQSDTMSLPVLRRLVGRDPNLNVVDFEGNTPLHTAVECDFVVIDVFCTGNNINAPNYKGLTPLHLAVKKGNTAAALTLLRHGADVRLTDEMLNTPVHFIVLSKYNEFSSIFADVNVPKTRNVFGQLSPLLWLSPDGDIDASYRDFLGNSALLAVADALDRPVKSNNTELFLSQKFDAKCLEECNAFGQNPLQILSLQSLNVSLSRILSDKRVKTSMTTTDGRGRNILYYFFLQKQTRSLSQYINDEYSRQAESLSGVDDDSVIMQISKPNKVEAHIANSELKSKGRWCIYSRLDVDIERMTQGGRVDDVVGCCSRDSLGRTPLHGAVMNNFTCNVPCGNNGCWCTCFLFFFGVDCLRIQDMFGRTPVHYAALKRKKPSDNVRRILSAAGFNVDDAYNGVRDVDGFTPQQLSGNVEIIPVNQEYSNMGKKMSNLVDVLLGQQPEKNLGQLWSQFVAHIDTWSLWQEELERKNHSSDGQQLTTAVNDAVTSFMERLVDAIGREDTRLRGRLLGVGSAFEQTRRDRPDEFDFNVVLTNLTDICQVCRPVGCPPGFVVLQKASHIDLLTERYAAYAEFFNDDETLKTPAVNFLFQKALVKVLSWQTFWTDEPLFELSDKSLRTFYRITANKLYKTFTLTISRPIHGKHIGYEISVDVVPVINLPDWWPDDGIRVDDAIRSEGCNFVFDQPYRKYLVPFCPGRHYVRISFARAESMSLRRRPAVVRASYIVAKGIFRPFENLRFVEQFNSMCLSSHVLKTAALSLTCAVGDDEDSSVVSEAALRTQVEKLFAKVYEFAVRDCAVSSFMPSFRVPLWYYEPFVGFSHIVLRRTSMDYETLFNAETRECKLAAFYNRFRKSLVGAYVLYAAVCSDKQHTGVEWTYP